MTKKLSFDRFFSDNGILADLYSGYSARPLQTELAKKIYDALKHDHNVLAEAGTGIGKSLAYLIPVLFHCISEGKRCAVSTETKTLQNQLIEKEIPVAAAAIEELTGITVTYDICLGSANYVCSRRFEQCLTAGSFAPKEIETLEHISSLLQEGTIFSRLDISISAKLWRTICRDHYFCLHSKCPHFGTCPFQQAKRSWNNSTLLILNHYLFFTHIATGRTYLPYIDVIVFDEAHSIPDICKKQLGFEYDRNFIHREFPKDEITGMYAHIITSEKRDLVSESLGDIFFEYSGLFLFFETLLSEKQTVYLPYPVMSADRLNAALSKFFQIVDSMSEDDADDYFFMQMDGIQAKLLSLFSHISMLSRPFDTNWAFWIEDKDSVTLCGQPVETAPLFTHEIIPYFSSIISLSATLTTHDDFTYFKEITGFADFTEIILKSEFDYKTNVRLFLPNIKASVHDSHYVDQISACIKKLTESAGGNVLVLFNSYSMLIQCTDTIELPDQYTLISQEEYNSIEAVSLFKNSSRPLLFGTHSFWQGIDLPGDLLKTVIITRLPFPPPNRPDIYAYSEKIKDRGGDPFRELMLPYAVIKFRQGFGRLMRSRQDRGIVAVLDDRIRTKKYGAEFMQSIPLCTVVDTFAAIEEFCVHNGWR